MTRSSRELQTQIFLEAALASCLPKLCKLMPGFLQYKRDVSHLNVQLVSFKQHDRNPQICAIMRRYAHLGCPHHYGQIRCPKTVKLQRILEVEGVRDLINDCLKPVSIVFKQGVKKENKCKNCVCQTDLYPSPTSIFNRRWAQS